MENMSLKCGDFVTLLTVLCQKKHKRVNENCKYVISVKKIQMLFEENIASNVTRNQESKHLTNLITNTKSCKTTLKHAEPCKTIQSHTKPHETMPNHKEPRKTSQNNSWEHIETFET